LTQNIELLTRRAFTKLAMHYGPIRLAWLDIYSKPFPEKEG